MAVEARRLHLGWEGPSGVGSRFCFQLPRINPPAGGRVPDGDLHPSISGSGVLSGVGMSEIPFAVDSIVRSYGMPASRMICHGISPLQRDLFIVISVSHNCGMADDGYVRRGIFHCRLHDGRIRAFESFVSSAPPASKYSMKLTGSGGWAASATAKSF